MAGLVDLGPQRRWSAATWLFDWVVNYIARTVDDPELSAQLRVIVDANLGWFGLDEVPPNLRDRVLTVLRDELVPAAQAELPPGMRARDEVIGNLRRLADLVRSIPPG
jgi:hypothetical protein